MTSDARKRQAEQVAHNHGIDPSCVERVVGACLVTIDPDDHEQVERLENALGVDHYCGTRDLLAASLREFANPTPARPEEPTGLGAVVEDADGVTWVRVGDYWRHPDALLAFYGEIAAVRVLSDGVQP